MIWSFYDYECHEDRGPSWGSLCTPSFRRSSFVSTLFASSMNRDSCPNSLPHLHRVIGGSARRIGIPRPPLRRPCISSAQCKPSSKSRSSPSTLWSWQSKSSLDNLFIYLWPSAIHDCLDDKIHNQETKKLIYAPRLLAGVLGSFVPNKPHTALVTVNQATRIYETNKQKTLETRAYFSMISWLPKNSETRPNKMTSKTTL